MYQSQWHGRDVLTVNGLFLRCPTHPSVPWDGIGQRYRNDTELASYAFRANYVH